MTHIAIIGAGQAGSSAAFKLRSSGFSGDVTLIGSEAFPPYQRPPLSKGYLLGEVERERLFLRPEASYADNNIRLMLGAAVSSIDAAARNISIGTDVLHYDDLILTTGSAPITLPDAIGGTLGGVYTVLNT